MASTYGPCFGFRRSDETLAIREGRQRVPATGTFLQGQAVKFNTAAPGYLMLAANDEPRASGFVGVLVQEEAHIVSTYDNPYLDTFALSAVKNDRLAIIWSGPGGKIWLKNIVAGTRKDGRPYGAITMIAGTGVTWPALGDYLAWNGTAWKQGTAATGIARVTASNETAKYIEAVLLA
jgi:hypothetical protein